MVTTEVDARSVDLTVPLNSWVAKGQVIGAAEWKARLEQSPARARFVSPADGLLIATDLFPGALGIASDPSLLCVYTRVRPDDIPSLRLGEQALIAIYSEPTATLHAKVSAIGAVPINYSDEAVYPVTLVVEDPEGKRFAGASVQIQLLPGVR